MSNYLLSIEALTAELKEPYCCRRFDNKIYLQMKLRNMYIYICNEISW